MVKKPITSAVEVVVALYVHDWRLEILVSLRAVDATMPANMPLLSGVVARPLATAAS